MKFCQEVSTGVTFILHVLSADEPDDCWLIIFGFSLGKVIKSSQEQNFVGVLRKLCLFYGYSLQFHFIRGHSLVNSHLCFRIAVWGYPSLGTGAQFP